MTTATAGERVLVVDDEPDIVALVAYHLAKAGYRVSTASSGTEAIDAVRRERPSLVVLDLMLPGMTGYEVLEQIRANEPTRDVAVLMLTARREEPDRIHGLSLGADDYLTKPFSPQELVLRVGAILRRVGASGASSRDRLLYRVRHAVGGLPIYGRMFWFSRKKFVGSYVRLSARSRSYLASP